jgi:hypothetical protein
MSLSLEASAVIRSNSLQPNTSAIKADSLDPKPDLKVTEATKSTIASSDSSITELVPAKIDAILCADTLHLFDDSKKAELIYDLLDANLYKSPEIFEKVLKVAIISDSPEVLDAAVNFFWESEDERVEGVMRSAFRIGKADSYSEGLAIAYLLDKYPGDKEIRTELKLRLKKSGVVANEFATGLFESNIPSAVALALDQTKKEGGLIRSWFAPFDWIKLQIENSLTLDQNKKDLNRIAYHLLSSSLEDFSDYADKIEEANATLLGYSKDDL